MTIDNFSLVQEQLLHKAGIDEQTIKQSLSLLNERKIDFGDLFFEHTIAEGFSLEEGIVKNGAFSIHSGVGVRAVLGEKCGYAYSDVIAKNALLDACRAARSISHGHSCERACVLSKQERTPLYVADNPISNISSEQKIALLHKVNQMARDADPLVEQVNVSLKQQHRLIMVIDTDGHISVDIKPVVQLAVYVMLKQGEQRESGFAAMGGAYLPEEFLKEELLLKTAIEAVSTAKVNLEAIPAPAGLMPVVLASGWPGVLIHEAVGHGLEADYTQTTNYSKRLGEKVASDACTIIDDGTIANRRGSQSCDDEGTPTNHNVLIENGVLKNFMYDKKSALLLKSKPTGNGRRESYEYAPLPRMTNTYMQPGKYTKEEVISSVKRGLYAVNFSGGQVDTTSGRFVFSASEAYLIENGKVTTPVKGATLIGNGPDTMCKVSMVANDLKFDQGIGVCGKAGQSVMVGIGQPTLKIDEITVGGSATNE